MINKLKELEKEGSFVWEVAIFGVLFALAVAHLFWVNFTEAVYEEKLSRSLLPLWVVFDGLWLAAVLLLLIIVVSFCFSLTQKSKTNWYANDLTLSCIRILAIPAVMVNSTLLLLPLVA